jgi:enoyl-CoA hydratase/carnithine racemase
MPDNSTQLVVECERQITTLTLNRPEKHNALSPELVQAVTEAGHNGTRLLVIKGTGKSLCAGFDFTDVRAQSDADLVLRFVHLELLLQAVYHAPCATLALGQGACFGAGADLFAACTARVCATGTKFRMPGLRFGVVLGTRRLANLIGATAARGLLESTQVFDAEQALHSGFATDLRAQGDWVDIVTQATRAATSLPAEAQRAMLVRTVTDSRDADLAALTRSVAAPGLRERIVDFIDENSAR